MPDKKFCDKLVVTFNESKARIVHVRNEFESLGYKKNGVGSSTYRLMEFDPEHNQALLRPSSDPEIQGWGSATYKPQKSRGYKELIEWLNPVIRGWGNYFAKLTFAGWPDPSQRIAILADRSFHPAHRRFRPRWSCHVALIRLREAVKNNPTNHIVEEDIKGTGLSNKRIQRMVNRFLRAGIAEDGNITVSDERTQQGQWYRFWPISIYTMPLISDPLRRQFRGLLPVSKDAERFREELGIRLKFGLQVEPTKTKVMEFGWFAVQHAKKREIAETLNLLGFNDYCGTRKEGSWFRIKRVAARKKLLAIGLRKVA